MSFARSFSKAILTPLTRGTIGTYQTWANLVGDQSYQFSQLLPFFEKSVHFSPPNYSKRGGPTIPYDPKVFSPNGGPIQVSYPNYYEPFSDAVLNGFSKLGFREIPGLNSGSLLGFAEFTLTVDSTTATRSASDTFLQAAIANSTLQVYQSTLAKRILFNSNKTASAVEIDVGGITSFLSARKEVILAAGAVCILVMRLLEAPRADN